MSITIQTERMTENEDPFEHMPNFATEVLIYIFSFLKPKDLTRCREVCVRWKLIVDSLFRSEILWRRHCYNDFADICKNAYYKRKSDLSWCHLYRSLSLWPKLQYATETYDEFASASRITEEIREFQVLGRGEIGVRTKGGIVYYDMKTLKQSNRDISRTRNNEVENVKSETYKIEKASDLTENSQKRPVIKTIIEKNDATKVYKAVTFAEQKQKSVTPLQIKIPVSLKNISVPNNVATGNTKSPKTLPNNDENSMGNKKNQNISHTDENMTGTLKKLKISPTIDNCSMNNIKISKLLHNNDKNLMRNINKPNDDDSSMNIKMPIVAATRNTKVPLVLKNILTKNTKTPHNNGDSLKRNTKLPKTKTQSKNSESVTCVKTKISKKEKKKLRESDVSHLSSVKGSKSPTTEVAKWAPSCINKHTQPYYEAWVDTTLAAITRSTGKDHENQNLIRSFKRMLEERPKTPDLVHENYLDERYIGKIKINHRQ